VNTYQTWHPKNDSTIQLEAESMYDAQCKAGEHWKLKKNKQYQIALVLLQVGDKEVIHSTSEFG